MSASPLQDIFRAQALVLTGLIAHLTGAALQADIALTSRRLQQLALDIAAADPDGRETIAVPAPPAPNPQQFSWLDHRLVRERRLERCPVEAWALLYLFLVTVGDARGLSYYSDASLTARLPLDRRALLDARQPARRTKRDRARPALRHTATSTAPQRRPRDTTFRKSMWTPWSSSVRARSGSSRLWAMDQLGLRSCLQELGIRPSLRAAAIGSIIARMAHPGSERATRRWLGERSALDELLGVDFQTLEPMQLYRASDALMAHREAIEHHLFDRAMDLFDLHPTITLYERATD